MIQNLDDFPFVVYAIISVPLPEEIHTARLCYKRSRHISVTTVSAPLQEDIIRHLMDRKDALVLMPTGGGKSICYQLPALLSEGTAVVVSPLISLMKDQVETLCANGIAAGALNSNNDETENASLRRACMEGKLKLLYISPEKLLAEATIC